MMRSTGTRSMARRSVLLALCLLLPASIAATACGGGGADEGTTASPAPTRDGETLTPGPTISSPRTSPTLPPEPTPSPTPTVNVSPLDPFDVRATEAINVRAQPTTGAELLATIFPGETATVLGEAPGETVETEDPKWYQVEFAREGTTVRGFLYAAYVAAVP